jgi:predicted aspartyl protease
MPTLSGVIVPNFGPMVDLLIGMSHQRLQVLSSAGHAAPPLMRIRGIIDTGATCTCIDSEVIARLGLVATGSTLVHTTSTGDSPIEYLQYDVDIVVDQAQKHVVRYTLPIVASPLSPQGFEALIGRDILDCTTLFYNGPEARFIWSL